MPATTHAFTLEGHQANTPYFYRLLADGRPLTGVMTTHISHGPADTRFRFLVFGDTGTGGSQQMDVARLVNASGAHLGLHTGDVIYDFGEEAHYDSRFFHRGGSSSWRFAAVHENPALRWFPL